MFTLYKLTFPNGKCYIGQTTNNMQTRFNQHRAASKRGSDLPVHCAWRKHGDPELKIIGVYAFHDDLHQAEIESIVNFNSRCPNGYNVTKGGETAPSKCPAVAEKIAAKARGRKVSDTSKQREASLKSWQSDEYRRKVSDGLKASWDDEKRAAASERSKKMWAKRKAEGWTMPESQRRNISKREISDETRAKISAGQRGRAPVVMTEEMKERHKKGVAASWANPEVKAKRIASLKATWERKRKEKAQ